MKHVLSDDAQSYLHNFIFANPIFSLKSRCRLLYAPHLINLQLNFFLKVPVESTVLRRLVVMFHSSKKTSQHEYLKEVPLLMEEMQYLSSQISSLAEEEYEEALQVISLEKNIQQLEVKYKVNQLREGKHENFDKSHCENLYYSSLQPKKQVHERRVQQIHQSKNELKERADELANEIRELRITITCDTSLGNYYDSSFMVLSHPSKLTRQLR